MKLVQLVDDDILHLQPHGDALLFRVNVIRLLIALLLAAIANGKATDVRLGGRLVVVEFDRTFE